MLFYHGLLFICYIMEVKLILEKGMQLLVEMKHKEKVWFLLRVCFVNLKGLLLVNLYILLERNVPIWIYIHHNLKYIRDILI